MFLNNIKSHEKIDLVFATSVAVLLLLKTSIISGGVINLLLNKINVISGFLLSCQLCGQVADTFSSSSSGDTLNSNFI